MAGPARDEPEIPDWLLSAGRLVGLSRIQTRWKILRAIRRWQELRREVAPASRPGFEHQICGECGALQDAQAKTCSRCGHGLLSRAGRVMKSIGLSLPSFMPATALLGLAIIFVYFRMMMAEKGQGYLSWDPEVLLGYGGLWPPLLHEGQWWRLGTALFIHIGIMHVAFNVVALSQIGPAVEGIFGRGRMVFLFVATGLLSFAASAWLQPFTPTAGASGAVMGLVGAAGGWGQRVGTSAGRAVRDQMIKWGAYTMLFGLLVGANHVAHVAGFVAGAIAGYAPNPHRLEKTKAGVANAAMGVVGGLAVAAFVIVALFPPASSWEVALRATGRRAHRAAPQADAPPPAASPSP